MLNKIQRELIIELVKYEVPSNKNETAVFYLYEDESGYLSISNIESDNKHRRTDIEVLYQKDFIVYGGNKNEFSITESAKKFVTGENLNSIPDINKEIIKLLNQYEKPLKSYKDALSKFNNGMYSRNLIDDLRLSLELLLKEILDNNKSIENQIENIGQFLKQNNLSKEFRNMFQTLIKYYTNYQNENIKHNYGVKEEEIEFLFEITSSFMKHFIQLKNNETKLKKGEN